MLLLDISFGDDFTLHVSLLHLSLAVHFIYYILNIAQVAMSVSHEILLISSRHKCSFAFTYNVFITDP